MVASRCLNIFQVLIEQNYLRDIHYSACQLELSQYPIFLQENIMHSLYYDWSDKQTRTPMPESVPSKTCSKVVSLTYTAAAGSAVNVIKQRLDHGSQASIAVKHPKLRCDGQSQRSRHNFALDRHRQRPDLESSHPGLWTVQSWHLGISDRASLR